MSKAQILAFFTLFLSKVSLCCLIGWNYQTKPHFCLHSDTVRIEASDSEESTCVYSLLRNAGGFIPLRKRLYLIIFYFCEGHFSLYAFHI